MSENDNWGGAPVDREGVKVMRLDELDEAARLDALLYGHYSGLGQWLNSTDVDLAWARIDFLESR